MVLVRKSMTKSSKANFNISALSSANVSKYDFLTRKDVLTEKELLGKADAINRFEYLLLAKKLKP